MNKSIILAALAGFAGGVAVGAGSVVIVNKIKDSKKKEPRKALLLQDAPTEPKKVKEKKEEAGDDTAGDQYMEVPTTPEEKQEYKEILTNEGYSSEQEAAEAEFPQDEDPMAAAVKASLKMHEQIKAYREEHEGKIEMMREDEWDTDFPEEDYEHSELWFFPDEYILTDEDGNTLEPIEEYVGNLFEKTRFPFNNWEVLYVRNHPREEDFKIHKETRMGRDEFFY